MRKPSPGNRLVVGASGVVFEVPAAVASGLVGNGSARYVGVAVAAAPAGVVVTPPARPVQTQPDPEPPVEQVAPVVPKRRGRPPKRPITDES